MTKLCIFGVMTVLGYAGWFIGDACGFSFFVSFLLSGLGSIAGVYLGWKLGRRFE